MVFALEFLLALRAFCSNVVSDRHCIVLCRKKTIHSALVQIIRKAF